ncbi:MAG: ABC transporter permease [Bacteroidales bacterium]|nr:ABC transporter permease [Bacteroidales bacterium]
MDILRVILRELQRIVRYPRYPILLTLGGVLTFVLFATMTHHGQPTRLPVAVVDLDGTYLSRRICHELNATQGVRVEAVYNSHTEARKAMQRGRIYAFYEIPKGTYNEVLQFHSPHFVLYVNSAYMLAGTLSYKQLATMGMLATGAVQREVYRKKGMEDDQIMGLIQPVEYDTRNIGNPWINYGNYLMTTLIPAVLAFIVVMHTAYTIARERRQRTVRGWLRRSRGSVFKALVGKMVPYTAWYTLLGLVANLIMFGPMGFPLEGSWGLMVLNTVLLVIAAQCVATFIACLIPDPPLTMSICALYSAMSFSLAGFSFPVDSMPPLFQSFCMLYPIRHYYLNYCNIAIYGNGLEHCWPNMCMLIAFGLMLPLSASFLGWQVHREERRHALALQEKEAGL